MSLQLVRVYGVWSLQGLPQPGRRSFGIPPGGAFDLNSYRLANQLVGNSDQAKCIEFGMATGEFRANEDMYLALVGADYSIDGVRGIRQASFRLPKGATLRIELPERARSYLAVLGGWTHLASEALVFEESDKAWNGPKSAELPMGAGPLRVVLQESAPVELTAQLLDTPMKVSQKLDRVGIRFEGKWKGCRSGTSEPSGMGVVQSTEQDVIIHGPDGPTIGGYQKLACVIRADWSHLGQLMPGEEIRFEPVTLEEAHRLDLQSREDFKRSLEALTGVSEALSSEGCPWCVLNLRSQAFP